MRDNYQNPKTKETFHISFVRSAYNKDTKSMMYFDRDGNPLQDTDGTLLVPYSDDSDMGTPSIRTQTKNR